MKFIDPKRALPSRIVLSGILFILGLAPFTGGQENMGRGRITGVVQAENGSPVEGALVLAESLAGNAKLEAKTDAKGRFAIAGLGTGAWRISASKAGYINSSVEMNVAQLKANPPATLTLKKMTGVAALQTDKESSELFDKGNLLFTQGQYDEAIRIFQEFLTKYPEIYQAHLNIGSCYFKKDDMEKARAEFQLVLDTTLQKHGAYKKDPSTSIRALSGLGEIALKANDFETGQKYFREALDTSPEDETAAYNVAEIFFSNQKIDEAIRYFEMSSKIKQDWSKPVYRLGIVYLNKGDFPKALEYLAKFVQMDPQNPEVPTARNMIAALEKMKK